ncbi:MAG: hypothetical protein ACE14V_11665 [bacterium]
MIDKTEVIHEINDTSSSISSLKEVVTIITGLTITTAITRLMINPQPPIVFADSLNSQWALCLLLLTNIIRFYHGNMRHLDTAYLSYSQQSHTQDVKYGRTNTVALDFIAIITECIILCFLSFLINNPIIFYRLFIALLITDAAWGSFAFTHDSSEERFRHQKRWVLINGATVIVMFIIKGAIFPINIQSTALFFILSFATVADYYDNWYFYFPLPKSSRKQIIKKASWDIFFAAPFTDMVIPETKKINDTYRKRLELLWNSIESNNHKIVCAHRREDWGANLESPVDALAHDRAAIHECDVLVAYLGNPLSYGVQLEIGLALQSNKPIVVIRDDKGPCPYLLRSENGIKPFPELVWNDDLSSIDIIEAIRDSLNR